MLKKAIAEFIGTFVWVLSIQLVVLTSGGSMLGILGVFGGLASMIYALGPVSGAHFNPVVTVAMVIKGKMTWIDTVPYIVVQVVAAAFAPMVAAALLGTRGVVQTPIHLPLIQSLSAEFIGTFILVLTYLQVFASNKTPNNPMAGMAIGLAFICGYICFGSSKSAFNPAIGFSFCIGNSVDFEQFWIYLVGGVGGGVLAALVSSFMEEE
jgi:aquaporin Z